MLEDLQYDHPSKVFLGVRFVLLGFDPITKPKVLSKLVDGGGVDVGRYGPICTHVIVDKLIYDDPICVAARNDGKTLVNGLWVAHSFDVGMPVDPTSIMYRPLRDLKGIPGAKSLVVCLTGYQRQDRDDIMTMVDLMGANFSKPLVANKVTHLICYKFEGEKYELAKKMKKIKLVNHLWLEDCLKAWEILPEADYNKSGYELEELEAEAKDSDEETDIAPKQFQLPNPKQELQRNQLDSSASRDLSNVVCTNDMVFANGKDRKSDQDPNLPEIHIKHPQVLDSCDARAFRDVSCVELVKSCDRTIVPAAIGNGLASTSGSERSPHSDASKLSPKSYSRKTPRETTPTMYLGEMSDNLNTAPTVNAGKLNVSRFDISSMTEQLKDGTDSGLKIPKETVSHHEEQSSTLDEKQKMDVSCGSSKSQKAGQKLKAHISEGLLEMHRSELLEPSSWISDPTETNNCLSNNVAHSSSLTAAFNSPQRSPAKISKYQSSSVGRKSPTCCTPVSKTVNSEISQDGNLEKALQTSSAGSKKTSLASKPENMDVVNKQEHATGEALKISSPRSKRLEIEKSNGSSNLSFHADAHSTPTTRKMFSRKSCGKGKTNLNTNLKGSLYLNKSASGDDPAISLNLGEETAGHEKLEMVSPEVNLNTEMEAETYDVSQSRNKVQQKSMSMDDETEAPEEEENEVRETAREEKYGEVEPDIIGEDDKSEDLQTNKTSLGVHSHSTSSGEDTGAKQNKVNCGKRKLGESTRMPKAVKNISKGKRQPLSKIKKTTKPSEASEDKEENEVQEAVNEETYREVEPDVENVGAEDKSEAYKTDCNALGVDSHKTSGEDKDGPKHKKVTCGKRKLGESTHMGNEVRENINAGKKCSKIKKRLGPVSKLTNLKEAVNEEAESEKNEGSIPHLAGKTKRNESTNKLDKSMEVEKENRPIHTEDQNVSHGKKQAGKLASNKSSSKIDMEASKSNLDRVQVQGAPKSEPAQFILTAHKLQRKEFQQVIRRLKGKVCRDSHQWSYQATHFIVADPVRRTEKFFAAVASGRWILKTDYLIDSSQAGKFLAEEPYEWHKSGLSEDGAINLEAPRKWRLHRERTGHGAFYGMSIIIYGECIAPSLDTLKRVLKAGEGKILATSPPYTRFLESGVDFAVVSPGMPRVDMWVQEFLRHEIPCVVADYLVEFVCKPGHSLERHVQYNTHALAEKALKNLVSRSEAIVGLVTPPSHGSDSDIPCHEVMTPPNDSDVPCQVCGSRDRGEEMLICGDESGSTGCGVGTHIDCCDPPLADVPEEDWFCTKCSESKSSMKPSKNAKKRTHVSKRK